MKGLYKVEYAVGRETGRSVMYARNGKLLGGNSTFAHIGTFRTDGDDVVAELRATRHHGEPGERSLLGAEDATLTARGRMTGEVLDFSGGPQGMPDGVFRSHMTPLDDETPPAGTIGPGALPSGLYSIEIEMLDGIRGRNSGVMLLLDGVIFGGDAYFYYLGSYSSCDGRWKGELLNQEHTPSCDEHPLFRGHQVGIGFTGTCDSTHAFAEATALVGKLSMRFQARLQLLERI